MNPNDVFTALRAWFTTNPYEAVGVAFGIISVWLTVRENIWCWPTGLINVGLYILIFYQARLYAGMWLQVIYVALCLYGWYEWLHGGQAHGPLTVSRTRLAEGVAMTIIGAAFAFALGTYLHRKTDQDLPYLDSTLTSFSLVAQWMQTRKLLENWIVWIAVDLVYVGMLAYKHLYLTVGQYALFLIMAAVGFDSWRKSMLKTGVA